MRREGARLEVERAEIARSARPLRTEDDLDPLIDDLARARVVLLGEASHGTSEYYRWRAAITKRLITEHGFSFVAVEGDWPDCFDLNCWLKGRDASASTAADVLRRFDRWPSWMWANEEVAEFADWLRAHNDTTGAGVGFFGLDVYSLWESIERVLGYLREHRPESMEAALRASRCFQPYAEDPQRYAFSTRMIPDGCEREVVRLLSDLRPRIDEVRRGWSASERELDAWQNAEVVAGAERYYRTMMRADGESWNVRDCHMVETLDRLLEHHGPESKAVVWEHNTHVGDARATDMAAAGMLNVGQVVRQRHGADRVRLVGFGGYEGSVVAAGAWGAPAQRMPVPPAPAGTHEALIHDVTTDPALFVFPEDRDTPWLAARRGHRAIGVVYEPARERYGNWVPTVMGRRYDAFVSFATTEALHPLHPLGVDEPHPAELETAPWGT